MLHLLEAKIHSEEFSTGLAGELLDITIFVVAHTPFDNQVRFAVDASLEGHWFDYSSFNLFPYGQADLDSPNVLADYFAVLEVGAIA